MSEEQLKFVASMFRLAMVELNNVMGPETIQTTFRLVGENQGAAIAKRLEDKFKLASWTPNEFAQKFVENVLDPALGKGNSEVKINGKEITLTLKECPFKRAGIDISNKFYCTYTEGLIDNTAKKLLKNTEFKSIKLRSKDNCDCTFKVTIA